MTTMDEGTAERIRSDWRSAPISTAERAMLAYAEKLTDDATSVRPDDLEALRAEGFDDVAITQINLIASFFNYVNRVADGLGVGR